jgi:hypothetical protein
MLTTYKGCRFAGSVRDLMLGLMLLVLRTPINPGPVLFASLLLTSDKTYAQNATNPVKRKYLLRISLLIHSLNSPSIPHYLVIVSLNIHPMDSLAKHQMVSLNTLQIGAI